MANRAISLSHRITANAIWMIHLLLLTFPSYAWAMSNPFRWTSIFLIIIVELHWYTYDGKCILTELEAYLRGESETLHGRIAGDDIDFFRGLFAKFGIHLSIKAESYIIHSLCMLLALLALAGIAGYVPVLLF